MKLVSFFSLIITICEKKNLEIMKFMFNHKELIK